MSAEAQVSTGVSLWDVLSSRDTDVPKIFGQIEKRDGEALAELTVGLRMLSLLLALSGSAVALFFLSPEVELAANPALLNDPLLRFHGYYVSHFPAVAIILLFANLLVIGGLLYIQTKSGWPRDIVRLYGAEWQQQPVRKSVAEWRQLFLERLADAIAATERMEKVIFAGAALIILMIPVQLAVIAALVTIFRKALT